MRILKSKTDSSPTFSPYSTRAFWMARAAWQARLGMVLVGHRGAEKGHDPVSRKLVDGPLIFDGSHP